MAHDFVGNLYVTLSMLCLGGIGWLLRKKNVEKIVSELSVTEKISSPTITLLLSCFYAFSLPHIFTFYWFSALCPKPENFTWSVNLGESTQQLAKGVEDVLQFDYGKKEVLFRSGCLD